MEVTLQIASDQQTELISPTSVTEVLELKDLIEGSHDCHTKLNAEDRSLALEMLVCVSNCEGIVKYSNFGLNNSNESKTLNIVEVLNIKCPIVNRFILKNNQHNVPEINSIETLLHGHVCFVTLSKNKIPVILKLQQIMEHEKMLIWLFKKASIIEVSENGFIIDDDSSKQYRFTKLNFVVAVDNAGRLVNVPNDLLKKVMGDHYLCEPRYLEEIIDVSDEMKLFLKSYENDKFYEKFSTSSLDLAVEKAAASNISPIFCTRAKFRSKPEMIVSLHLFTSIYNNQSDPVPIFPIQVKYQSENSVDEISFESDAFPDFPGLKIIRKISESIQSTIYEAVRLFQSDIRIVIKVIHAKTHMAEIKFYEYFTKDSVGCEFIERPFKIELVPKPTIFMESNGNRIDLFDYIQSNSHLSDHVVRAIFKQVAKAIDYLHSNGIVHRDIKDENLLIDPTDLSIKLIDFGSSAFIEGKETEFLEYTGTFAYAPVEVLKGNPFNGPEQDVWCLGILLYILCFKEPPFHSPKEILQGFLRLPIERPFSCIQLIRQMLDPKPQNRPNIKNILNSAFLKDWK